MKEMSLYVYGYGDVEEEWCEFMGRLHVHRLISKRNTSANFCRKDRIICLIMNIQVRPCAGYLLDICHFTIFQTQLDMINGGN